MTQADPESGFESADDSPGFLLWQVHLEWQRHIKAVLTPLDLTHTQFVLLVSLWWLSGQGEEVSQSRLAAHARTDRMMTSKVLDALSEKKLVSRYLHETDQRVRLLGITAAGKKVLKKALHAVESADAAFFSRLGPKQKEFTRGMQQLLKG